MSPQPGYDSERLNALKAQWEQTQPFEIRALAEEIRARVQAQEAAMQRTTRLRTLALMVGLSLALLLLVVLLAGAFLESRMSTLPGADPAVAIQDFWNDIASQNYPDAYSYFSLDIKNSISIDQFIKQATALDKQEGVVNRVTLLTASGDNHSRFYTYRIARQRAGQAEERAQLLFDQSSDRWEIVSLTGKLMAIAP
jgi:hypothetical protein